MSKMADQPEMISKCKVAIRALEQALIAASDLSNLGMTGYVENTGVRHLVDQIGDNAVTIFEWYIYSIGGVLIGGVGTVHNMIDTPGHSILRSDGYRVGFDDGSIFSLPFGEDFLEKIGD